MPRNRITMSHVAEQAGVSRQVVSAVLNDNVGRTARCSSDTRRRVLEAVRLAGYRPNRTAKNMQRSRHGSIGILVHEIDCIPGRTLGFLVSAAKRHDRLVVLEHLPDTSEARPKLVREDCVDGLILFETTPSGLAEEVERLGIPVVRVNTNDRFGPGRITFDEEGAARLVARTFRDAGCRKPLFVGVRGSRHYSDDVRLSCFRNACEGLGMALPAECLLPDDGAAGIVAEMLHERPDTDCALLVQDRIAPAFYAAARAAGKTLPEDLKVVGFNDSLAAVAVAPPLSALSVDPVRLAESSVEMLDRMIEGQVIPEGICLPFLLNRRESA